MLLDPLEFRMYIASLPDEAFVPKPGDDRPKRPRRKAGKSCASYDRARCRTVYRNQAVARIRAARQLKKSNGS